ncbi:hypothetical protein [Argonema galeatum]|uniref:hypothetical protein n=1 Tax=Argonema galeatum TaxID=2942762 RepID=UPI002012C341|nr:hypothetical protein [Argonema galeatum]MCL1467874.1 hypothetical protein [Argonema galeatum A003/A1]
MTIATVNPALAFLQQIQQRQSGSVPSPPPPPPPPPPTVAPAPTKNWTRIEIMPGLEIHIRQDFIYPNNLQARQNLVQLISQKIFAIFNLNQSSK